MGQHWTRADCAAFTKDWLAEPHRQGHQWVPGQARCTACGRKFGKAAGALCPKRKKPGHWRLHLHRALMRVQYPPQIPKLDAAWILRELEDIRCAVRSWPVDDRLWKYHKLARRHRMLLRRWWALPVSAVPSPEADRPPDRWAGGITRERNKLLKRVKAEGTPIVQIGGCTYRFNADASYVDSKSEQRVMLFADETVEAV